MSKAYYGTHDWTDEEIEVIHNLAKGKASYRTMIEAIRNKFGWTPTQGQVSGRVHGLRKDGRLPPAENPPKRAKPKQAPARNHHLLISKCVPRARQFIEAADDPRRTPEALRNLELIAEAVTA